MWGPDILGRTRWPPVHQALPLWQSPYTEPQLVHSSNAVPSPTKYPQMRQRPSIPPPPISDQHTLSFPRLTSIFSLPGRDALDGLFPRGCLIHRRADRACGPCSTVFSALRRSLYCCSKSLPIAFPGIFFFRRPAVARHLFCVSPCLSPVVGGA